MTEQVRKSKELRFLSFMKTHYPSVDISEFVYIDSNTKSVISCKNHGALSMTPNQIKSRDLKGLPICKFCKKEQDFKSTMIAKYGDSILLDRVFYFSGAKKVTIGCKKHGYFQKTPTNLYKSFCKRCSIENMEKKKPKSKDAVLSELKASHPNGYVFNLEKYVDSRSKIECECEKHGKYESTKYSILRAKGAGCPECAEEERRNNHPQYKRYDFEAGTKECANCRVKKPIEDYPKYKCIKNGKEYTKVYHNCINCKRKIDNNLSKNPTRRQKMNEAHKNWRQNNPERFKASVRKNEIKKNLGRSNPVFFGECLKCKEVHTYSTDVKLCEKCYKHDCYKFKRLVQIAKDSPRECIVCNESFYHFEPGASEKLCSTECKEIRSKELRKKYIKKRREKIGGGSMRQRVKRFGVFYEPVNRKKVFEIDKYKCKICNISVQTKKANQDNTAELDHIIPLSKGGPHTYSNVQTLCRKCNAEKSDRLESGTQLTVFTDLNN